MIKIKHFEEIISDDLNEYYDTNVPFSGRTISIDLNFDSQTISEDLAERINAFIDRIPELNEKYLSSIQTDYLTGDTVKEYIEAHLDILDDPKVVSTLQIGDNTKDRSEQLLSLIHLKRVGIYPENDSNFATIDYTIGEEITQYLIVVVVQESGDIDYITMES